MAERSSADIKGHIPTTGSAATNHSSWDDLITLNSLGELTYYEATGATYTKTLKSGF